MQLIRSVLLALVLLIGVGWICFQPIRIVRDGSPQLAFASFGFQYEGKPFTGLVFDTFGRFQLAKLAMVYQGRMHGPFIQWYPNGQRFTEQHYENGLEVGAHKAWFEDGAVKYLKHFQNGVADGEFYEWHSNGQLAQFIKYDHGQETVAKSWTSGGKPFYNYVWNQNKKIGLNGDSFCSPKRN